MQWAFSSYITFSNNNITILRIMSSSTKTFVLLGLLLAIALLISSEVSANRDLLAQKEVVDVDVVGEKNTVVDENKQGSVGGVGADGGYCRYKRCGNRCCLYHCCYGPYYFCCRANAFGVMVESGN